MSQSMRLRATSSPHHQIAPVELEAPIPVASLSPAWSPTGGSAPPIVPDHDRPRTASVYSKPFFNASVSVLTSTNETSSSKSTPAITGLPRLDYRLYSPPLFELSPDCTTLSSRSCSHLTSNAQELARFMRAQASVPPKPQIHVKGKEFDIKLNLMPLLVPDDPRQRTDYIRCVGENDLAFRGGQKLALLPRVGDGGLEEWCQLFVDDKADMKSFVMNRSVVNMDTMWFEGQLRSLIASTGYKGAYTITFPVTHQRVMVRSADKSKFSKMFKSKSKYEVVQAVWSFATAKLGVEGRQCVVQSEESWWKEWRDAIKYAIATKRHGWVTNEDKLEAIMEGKGRGVQPIDWDTEMD